MFTYDMPEGFTFDDVLLVPGSSNFLPRDADVGTRLSRRVSLNIPLVSAAMDTVTESAMAIAMAQEGGIGVIHRNLTIEQQAQEVDKVKKSESGMIIDPVTVHPDQPIAEALDVMRRYKISGLPVTKDGKLVGILTNRDLRFEKRLNRKVGEVMTKENLVTAKPGISLEDATEILHPHRIEKLLIVDERDRLRGLITVKDINKTAQFPDACKDSYGRLRVAGAIGTGDDRRERSERLVAAGVDVLIIDTAHGHRQRHRHRQGDPRRLPRHRPGGRQRRHRRGARALAEAGADGLKVGMGPASICTVSSPASACRSSPPSPPRPRRRGVRHPADRRWRHQVQRRHPQALAGADSMIGGLFAGTEESPGETILYQGRTYKLYRGMGSLEAMREREEQPRSLHAGPEEEQMKLVPEGIEGRVPHKGRSASSSPSSSAASKPAWTASAARTIDELQTSARFMRVSNASLRRRHGRTTCSSPRRRRTIGLATGEC
ncbi:MAG: IMP dehydrogenase [Candidatus Binatia bacterium]